MFAPTEKFSIFFSRKKLPFHAEIPRIMKIQNITSESQDIFFTLDFFFILKDMLEDSC